MDIKAGKESKYVRGTCVLRPQFALFLSVCGFALMFMTIQNSFKPSVETSVLAVLIFSIIAIGTLILF